MAYNYGGEIRRVLKEKGMSVAEFAQRINKSRENAYDIFRRKSLDTELLSVISQVLDYDFISKSREKRVKPLMAQEPKAPYGTADHEILLMREELFILRKEIIDLRKRIVALETPRNTKKK